MNWIFKYINRYIQKNRQSVHCYSAFNQNFGKILIKTPNKHNFTNGLEDMDLNQRM